ncbi:MarR family transcriptional regulator [Streptomyces tendae]|uniref:MarR family transcriptional regulator n=1 Tax=Streptomyces tendae TaxID=1932 RepID=UPI00367DF875
MTAKKHPPLPDLSDRAHRVLFELVLRDGEWVEVARICDSLGLNSHQIRRAANDLRAAGVAERRRDYVRADTGRRTHRTFFRATETSEASA